jgi:glycogen debranching enzyme
MPFEIRVGPPTITISQGRTFMVTTHKGEILPNTPQGVYAMDTRFISYYRIYLNRTPLELIDFNQLSFYASRIHLTNQQIDIAEDIILEAHTIRVSINRIVSEGIHEDIDVVNYSGKAVKILLEIAMRSDFADLFEVRKHHIVLRGQTQTTWDKQRKQLYTSYDHKDFHRAVTFCTDTNVPFGYANGRIYFEIELGPNQSWQTCNKLILEIAKTRKFPTEGCCSRSKHAMILFNGLDSPEQKPQSHFAELQIRWQKRCTEIATSNHTFYRMYRQAIEDMGALRIYDMDVSDEAWIPAAGVPWFVTLFGRDSLIAAYQNMSVVAGFARGALKRLAEYQASTRDDWRDAQPGKIMHEIRFGELAHFHTVPFTPYYGTADATILYLIVLSEAYRWTGDIKLLTEYREVAEKCLNWIDLYGDLDGDGFQEYKTFSSVGYKNMGWKDAHDAVVYPDGSQVTQPIALCELQGYVYDAKMRMVEVFQALGDEYRATMLQQQAEALKSKFNQMFWLEDEGCYAFGLDPNKQLIRSITSNAGQCLWSGIADTDKAQRTAKRLLQEDMWSGWGIRTLSAHNPAYNPLAYQRGSVWPHDNGLIAAGFKRYGLAEEANQVIRGISDAIERFNAYRPPEVFAGVQREGNVDFPLLYPDGANIPQAWSTGSIFHMLQTMLGLRADAPHQKLYVQPTLPDWLPDIELQHLEVGSCSLSLRFWREGQITRWEVLSIQADNLQDKIQILAETNQCAAT